MHKIGGSGKARAKFDKYENKRYNLMLFTSGNGLITSEGEMQETECCSSCQ